MKIKKLWDKIGPYIVLLCIFGVACMITGALTLVAHKQQHIMEVKVCYQNKDTIIYAPRYCDITDTSDMYHNIYFSFWNNKEEII